MASNSPFVLTARQKAAQAWGFAAMHRRHLGPLVGVAAFGTTLGRFTGLRLRSRGGNSPMVDDAVAMAVASYRTLTRRLGEDAALAAVRDQVVATGGRMMQDWPPEERTVPALGRAVRVIMGDAEQRNIYRLDGLATSDTGLRLDVTACRYAELCRRHGAPEVASVFCAVDQPFVADALPGLAFRCDTTIAKGDDRCRFRAGDEA